MENKKLDGYVLSIFAIVFAFIWPIACYICGGIGLHKANNQIKAEPSTPRTAHDICVAALWIGTVILIIRVLLKYV